MAEQQKPEIKKVAKLMRELDFCMFTTATADELSITHKSGADVVG